MINFFSWNLIEKVIVATEIQTADLPIAKQMQRLPDPGDPPFIVLIILGDLKICDFFIEKLTHLNSLFSCPIILFSLPSMVGALLLLL